MFFTGKSNMDTKSKLRLRMLAEKDFLKQLFTVNNRVAKTLLQTAENSQLELLLTILRYIAIGEIPMRRLHHEKLVKAKRESKLRTLRTYSTFNELLQSNRKTKLTYLSQFCSQFNTLLSALFVQ